MSKASLNMETHERLKREGYRYFLITDIQLSDQDTLCSVTVKAARQIPANLKYSCTGIDDVMITSFIYKKGLDCEIYVEVFE